MAVPSCAAMQRPNRPLQWGIIAPPFSRVVSAPRRAVRCVGTLRLERAATGGAGDGAAGADGLTSAVARTQPPIPVASEQALLHGHWATADHARAGSEQSCIRQRFDAVLAAIGGVLILQHSDRLGRVREPPLLAIPNRSTGLADRYDRRAVKHGLRALGRHVVAPVVAPDRFVGRQLSAALIALHGRHGHRDAAGLSTELLMHFVPAQPTCCR